MHDILFILATKPNFTRCNLFSDVGIYDRVVIQEILKEIAQTQQVDLNAKQRFKGRSIAQLFARVFLTLCVVSGYN